MTNFEVSEFDVDEAKRASYDTCEGHSQVMSFVGGAEWRFNKDRETIQKLLTENRNMKDRVKRYYADYLQGIDMKDEEKLLGCFRAFAFAIEYKL